MDYELDEEKITRLLPEHISAAILRYVNESIPPGDFLKAVICNDLKEACGRADDEMRHIIFKVVFCFYNYTPSSCWGSKENYELWLAKRVL